METEITQLFDLFNQYWPYLAGLAVLAALIVSGMVGHHLLNPSDAKIIDAKIQSLAKTMVRDVVIPDGIYGYHFINYVILLPNKILLLGVYDYPGYIFGADNLEQWTQVLDTKSVRFDNPLMVKVHCIQAMEPLVKGKEVIARVVFTSNSEFPKGKPSDVIEQHLLEKELAELLAEPAEEDLSDVWQTLVVEFETQKQSYKKN